MNKAGKYTPFLITTVLMWLGLYLLYPHYQYYVDPDGTAYLTISKRYTNGDFHNAINGYWSPWSCWLTAILIKLGLSAIPSSVIINTLGATGFMFIAHSFFLHFRINRLAQWLFNGALAIFLCYAVYAQSFDDLWECFFLLASLRIMLATDFTNRPALWGSTGIIGALAYFAKAYSFPFFIANTFLCAYLLSGKDKQKWIKMSLVPIVVMLACAFPWIYALHTKYGIWTTSTAGTLNMSWYLIDHPYWKEGINMLVPPALPGSPYYWEDPYLVNGPTPHFWDSMHLAALQMAKLGLNSIKLTMSVLQLSLFFPFIILYAVYALFRKKVNDVAGFPLKLVCISFFLFPAGYSLINFESRYLWYLLPLVVVAGGVFIQQNIKKTMLQIAAIVAFSFSLIAYPVWKLMAVYNMGEKEYHFAERLKGAHIEGAMVSNLHPRLLSKIAYFSGNSFYFIAKQTPDNNSKHANTIALGNEISKYHIKYYLHYRSRFDENKSPSFDEIFFENLKDSSGIVPYPLVLDDTVSGIKVYRLD